MPPAERRRVAVVGGGIAGLAAAHRLVELSREANLPLELNLFEAGDRLGGVITTENAAGYVIEHGPDSFISEKPWGVALCERLGLTPRLVGTREDFRRTYVVHDGRLLPLPDGFLLMAPTKLWPLALSPLFSWPGKMRMALDLVLPRKVDGEDESLSAFVGRRLGREALQRVAQPLIGGIYTADPDRLSLRATMPRFLEMERHHRSLVLAMRRQRQSQGAPTSGGRWSLFLSFERGMQTLVDAMAQHLPEGVVRLRAPIRAAQSTTNGRWTLQGLEWDAVILAAPAWASAEMLGASDPALASELAAITYASSAIVTLAYRREDVPHPLDGSGFVVPFVEDRRLLAGTFSSIKFPGRSPADTVLLRAFVGGALQAHQLLAADSDLESAVQREYGELLGVTAEPILRRVTRHPQAMPQYHVGHLDRLDRIDRRLTALPGLALAGSAYRGVGIPDCIHSGEEAAAAVIKYLTTRR